MLKTHRIDIITIIAVGLLTFGLQVPFLGFFQDDWNYVFYSSARGPQGLLEFLLVDGRPGASWLFTFAFALLGYKPALWQFFSLFLRVLTVLNFWMILGSLWPQRRYGNLIAAIFFLAYPFFTLQPLSVSFAQHFAAYFLYSLSILLMIRAVEKPDRYLLYSIPAVLSTFLHLFTIEYFVGLELLRPFIIWFIVSRREKLTRLETLRKVVVHWAPYLLVGVFFIAWRSLLSVNTGVRNNPLASLFDVGRIIVLTARNILADLVLMSVTSWFKLINPESFVIGPIRNFYLFAATLFGGLCFYFLAKPANQEEEINRDSKHILLAGALIIATGMISTYAGGYTVHLKIAPWNSRFALASLMGLAMISAGLIEVVITTKGIRHIYFAILVGLLIGWHNQNTLNFKTAWEKQSRFYQQLMWRAPALEPNTALVASEEILPYMGDYPASFGINTIYESKQVQGAPYWFFTLSENFHFRADPIIKGGPLSAQKGTVIFQGTGQDAIFIEYGTENQQCLWVLRPPDSAYKYLSSEMKKGALASNYENILPVEKERNLYNQIVKENRDTWCYFYQKADLARQTEDWTTVIKLWKEAQTKGYHPDAGFEYIPFIEAHAHLNNWEDAFLLTRNANKTTEAMYFILCPTWENLARETGASEQKDLFVDKTYNLLDCSPGN